MQSKIRELELPGVPSDDARWELVQRVVTSPEFQRAPRLREFLQYVCLCALRNDAEGITEHQIGIHVFGCAPGYDSNVVRSQARQLRLKLDSHFANSGKHEQLRIVIPKGAYRPEFCPKIDEPVTIPLAAEPEGRRSVQVPLMALIAGGLVVLLAGVVIGIIATRQTQSLVSSAARNSTPRAAIVQLLSPKPGQHLNVIVEDDGLRVLRALNGGPVSLEDYASGNFLSPERLPAGVAPGSKLSRVLTRSYVTDTYALPVMARVFASIPEEQISVKHPREVTSRDFENDNSLLIGGPRVNPWVQMFEDKLNFRNELLPSQGGMHIRNQSPGPGEQDVYAPDQSSEISYGRIAYISNLGGNGTIMLVGGPTSMATVAATTFVVDPSSLQELLRILGAKTVRSLPFFEVVIEVKSRNGVVTHSKIVAWRKKEVSSK
jgi:hypothetical protein